MKPTCLSIGGFDGSGGAGIQADLKTFSALGCYGMSVLTALPIQNTCGVRNIYDIPLQCIEEQLQAIFDDISPSSIKVGMLFSSERIELVANFLKKNARNIPIILDPVMVAKSGELLLLTDAIDSLKKILLPLCTIVTPNLPEAYRLTDLNGNRETLAKKLLSLGSQSVLVKGGHSLGKKADDLFMNQLGQIEWFRSVRIDSKNTHGTGCTLSAAICAFISHGFSADTACKHAKHYVFNAIRASQKYSVGLGHGPIHHFYHLWPCINKIVESPSQE